MAETIFLDTSAQAVRIFYSEEDKSSLLSLIENSEKVVVSSFSRYEFFHTWYVHLGRIFNIASTSDEIQDVLYRFSKYYGSSNCLMTLLAFFTGKDREVLLNTRALAEQAQMWIEYMLDVAYITIPGKDDDIEEIDILNCTMLNEIYANHKWINDVGSFSFPKPRMCSRPIAHCNLHKIVKHSTEELSRASESLRVANRDRAFQEAVKDVLGDNRVARGAKNCSRLSDWTQIKHAENNWEIVSMDEDWAIITKDYGFKFHKIIVSKDIDKEASKESMSTEN